MEPASRPSTTSACWAEPPIFTVFSGNPTPEKVRGLTKIAIMYPGRIDAIGVIGGRANSTDIYDSLIRGIMDGIRETPDFDKTIPIVIRRAGPRDEEAFAALNAIRHFLLTMIKPGHDVVLDCERILAIASTTVPPARARPRRGGCRLPSSAASSSLCWFRSPPAQRAPFPRRGTPAPA